MFCRRHLPTPLRTVTDGTSNTIMVGETLPRHWVWNCVFCDSFPVSSTHIPINTMEGRENGYTDNTEHHKRSGFKSEHPEGINVLMVDGSVHRLSENMDYVTYNMIGSRAQDDQPRESVF